MTNITPQTFAAADQLPEIIAAHGRWLRKEEGGARANLTGANLARADLTDANLTGADLTGANLTGARLDKTIIADDVTTDRAPLQISGFEYPIAIWDNHAKIGCAFKSLSDWRAMTEVEAEKSDALRLFTARDAILALAAVDGRGVAAPALDLDAEADGAEGRVP